MIGIKRNRCDPSSEQERLVSCMPALLHAHIYVVRNYRTKENRD